MNCCYIEMEAPLGMGPLPWLRPWPVMRFRMREFPAEPWPLTAAWKLAVRLTPPTVELNWFSAEVPLPRLGIWEECCLELRLMALWVAFLKLSVTL